MKRNDICKTLKYVFGEFKVIGIQSNIRSSATIFAQDGIIQHTQSDLVIMFMRDDIDISYTISETHVNVTIHESLNDVIIYSDKISTEKFSGKFIEPVIKILTNIF